ncbi:hypothetical protein JZ751_027521 [Albula glossodonta]|uniref:Uncharacterized protein n=1 Tax=Albula glossodonta TaxID=121402 RepID=A0A8T2NC37_9TELE|nr:hypothetical protein JZ751_027521 [Albula glossodonta]
MDLPYGARDKTTLVLESMQGYETLASPNVIMRRLCSPVTSQTPLPRNHRDWEDEVVGWWCGGAVVEGRRALISVTGCTVGMVRVNRCRDRQCALPPLRVRCGVPPAVYQPGASSVS